MPREDAERESGARDTRARESGVRDEQAETEPTGGELVPTRDERPDIRGAHRDVQADVQRLDEPARSAEPRWQQRTTPMLPAAGGRADPIGRIGDRDPTALPTAESPALPRISPIPPVTPAGSAPDRPPPLSSAAAPTSPDAPPVRGSSPGRPPLSRSPSEPRYSIGDELGRGGMGRVIAATDTLLDRQVAIKQALLDHSDGLRRFEREAKITAQLEHPSIIPIHDAGIGTDGTPYYIMRRIAGEPLSDLVARAADAKARLAFVPNVLAAVDATAFAHARRIIHRDIKPWNILIGAYGETLVIDWGLARSIEDPIADAEDRGRAVGTPGYMAPEQARAARLDARSDVYALGATLLHVLIGKPLISGSETAWLERVAAGEPPPLAWIDRDVPVELVAIVAKAMAPEPEARYCDAGEMAADLRAFLAGQLVAAHEYTAWQRAVRFMRRHRIAFGSVALAAIAIIVIGVLAIVSVVHERDRATVARDLANDRAELMLVEHASALAHREPTRAVALLRQVPEASRHMQRARDVAAVAMANGIAHGKDLHSGSIVTLAFAPDGYQLMSASNDERLVITDVRTGVSRELLPSVDITEAVWTDRGRTITYASPRGVFVVDVATGRTHALEEGVEVYDLWTRKDDHVVRYVAGNRLVESTTDAGAPQKIVATDVMRAHGNGDRAIIIGSEGVRYLDNSSERMIVRDSDAQFHYGILALSDDGTHAAGGGVVGNRPEVVEWDLASGHQPDRWPTRGLNLFYGGPYLFVQNPLRDDELDTVLRGHGDTRIAISGRWSMVWHASAFEGVAFVNAAGDLAYVDDLGIYDFPTHSSRTRQIAGRKGSPYIAVGSEDGTVRWWDLRTMVPRHIVLPKAFILCHLDDKWIYVIDAERSELLAYPRSNGAPRSLGYTHGVCSSGPSGSLFLVGSMDPSDVKTIFNGVTGKSWSVVADQIAFVERQAYILRGRDVFSLSADTGEQIPRWRAPVDVVGMWSSPGKVWLVMVDARIAWFDLRTGSIVVGHLPQPADIVDGDSDRYWLVKQTNLYLADHGHSKHVAQLPRPIEFVRALRDGTAIIATSDHAMWRVTPDGTVLRRNGALSTNFTSGGERSFATVESTEIVARTYLDTGESVIYHTAGATLALVDDRSLMFVRQSFVNVLDIYDELVPPTPHSLPGWLDLATNAYLRPGSDDIVWR